MTILTIYFCGTGSNKFDDSHANYWNGELVSTLATHNSGKEFAEWVIIDGPGSGNLQSDEMWVKSGEYSQLRGQITGEGWKENIQHALHIIKGNFDWQREKLTKENYDQLKKAGVPIQDVEVEGSFWWRKYDYGDRKVTQQQLQQQIIKTYRKGQILPTQINLVGWSRGGISCHMLANAMLEDPLLTTIPVNIFAIDPVPGMGNFQSEKVTLGNNVREYVAFYAKDERSKGFSCVIPQTDRSTVVHIYPMAGRHATLVGNASVNGDNGEKVLYEPGTIVRHLAEACLKRWGVAHVKTLNLTDAKLLELHQGIAANAALYNQMHDYSYLWFTEKDQGERYVSCASTGAPFSSVRGERFSPQAGLASDFLADNSVYDAIK
ncbi:hypothetical protein [Lelliottia sp. CFBP8978]|uniref:hypothetical protein n=1 Tax=Lelliottia sp. CFBP8978 TaxID=3096522 RepID=UPI002A6B5667|nr:hypothetical protein [Lelliottia sp. CFBP8978]MDY1038520.1 hypothetical protein [Lelliottia sp. CFBP8978]